MRIPFFDLKAETDELGSELEGAFRAVLLGNQFIDGPQVGAFEQALASYAGVKHAVGLNSGTDALTISLRALGIGPGDDVITSAFSFFATAEAIAHVGAKPVFVDVDPVALNLDPALIEGALTKATKAIIPVHLFGRAAPMPEITRLARREGLAVVEDAAQALGAEIDGKKVGAWGDAAALSFFPTKTLGALGDGGALLTNSDDLAARARMLRSHGAKVKYRNEIIGYNSRLDTLQAAFLSVKLPHLDRWIEARRRHAARYDRLLENLPIRRPELHPACVWQTYTVRIPGGRRDSVRENLKKSGVETMVYYPTALHRLPAFAHLPQTSLPRAESASQDVLSLPLWPLMAEKTQDRVVTALQQALLA